MISSILSLYVAASLNPELPEATYRQTQANPDVSVVLSASQNLLSGKSKIPIKNPELVSPIIRAESSIGIDLNTSTLLFEKNIHTRRQIASITKLMTLLIILEENELSDTVIVSQNAANTEGSTMYLRPGEQIALENLIYGALLNSANDAAVALAEHNAGSVTSFVDKMNKKASELGLSNTNFQNPIGLDHSDNYSTAYDVAKLGQHIYQHQIIRQAAQYSELEVKSTDGTYTHNLSSTNDLLDSYINFKGLKTGRTDAAGLCFISIAENEQGNEVITVVLKSPARFDETKVLTDWIFRAYNWQE